MSTEPQAPSALADYRATFGNGFDLRRLWQDRRAIMANPRVTTEAQPPLSYSPLRFALMLSVVPLIALAWFASQVGSVFAPDGGPMRPLEANARAIEAALAPALAGLSKQQAIALARTPRDSLPAEARRMIGEARTRLSVRDPALTPERAGEAGKAFLAELDAAALTPGQRKIVAAKAVRERVRDRRQDKVGHLALTSLNQGGIGMQVISSLSLLLSARMFRRMLRRDERFPRRQRADALMLYYSTARLLWFTAANMVLYALMSFASASENPALAESLQSLQGFLGLAGMLWLLLGSRAMARALRDEDELPRGATRTLAWRLLLSQIVATVLLFLVAMVLAILVAMTVHLWTNYW